MRAGVQTKDKDNDFDHKPTFLPPHQSLMLAANTEHHFFLPDTVLVSHSITRDLPGAFPCLSSPTPHHLTSLITLLQHRTFFSPASYSLSPTLSSFSPSTTLGHPCFASNSTSLHRVNSPDIHWHGTPAQTEPDAACQAITYTAHAPCFTLHATPATALHHPRSFHAATALPPPHHQIPPTPSNIQVFSAWL